MRLADQRDTVEPVDNDERFVVAVRREKRDTAPEDWLDQVVAEGAAVIRGSGSRAQIRATVAVAERIRAGLGDYLLIERVNEHRRLAE